MGLPGTRGVVCPTSQELLAPRHWQPGYEDTGCMLWCGTSRGQASGASTQLLGIQLSHPALDRLASIGFKVSDSEKTAVSVLLLAYRVTTLHIWANIRQPLFFV